MSIVRSSALVGGWTLVSRMLGFLRDLLLAVSFGSGFLADAFVAAFQIPNLFRRIFAEGAFNSAFVPMFAARLAEGGAGQARVFAEQILSVLLVMLLMVNLLAIIFMPQIVTILAPGYSVELAARVTAIFGFELPFTITEDPRKMDVTVEYARILFPYLIFASLMALFSAILNSFNRFALAAAAPSLLNIVGIMALGLGAGLGDALLAGFLNKISMLVGLSVHLDPSPKLAADVFIFAILFSGLLQAGIVAWGVARAGLSLRLRFIAWGPGIKDFFHLLGPGILAGGVVQINIMAGGIIASFQDGARAHLYYADRLYQFPLGLIGVAISVVLLPKLTAALKKNDGSAPGLVDESLITAMFLTLPAAFGLAVLAEPIIATLFEHGRFTAQDTAATAAALIGFAAGLPAYVLVKIFSPSFFARLDTRTPMRLAVLSMVVNITISLIFFPIHGHVAIAWATAVASMVQAAGLIIIMWWRNYHQWRPALVMRLVKLLLASMVMAMLLFFLPSIAGGDWLARFLDLSLRVGLGVGVFVMMVLGLKVVRVSDISRWRGHSS